MKIKIAARGSKLSLKQVSMFTSYLLKFFPDLEYEVITVKTTGDKANAPFEELAKRGLTGLFEKEVNKAVLEGKADVAVHSLKDLPTELDPRLEIAAFLPRDPPYDVLISRAGNYDIFDLPKGSVVGTSSARRKALIKNLRPDLVVKDLRGNVDTRLEKLRRGEYDAIVLAEAGGSRLGLNVDYVRLDWRLFPPSPGQGIIVAVTRKGSEISDLLKSISDVKSEKLATAERTVLKEFGGGCFVALGAIAFEEGSLIRLRATVLSPSGRERVDVELIGKGPEEVGMRAAERLKALNPMKTTVGSEE